MLLVVGNGYESVTPHIKNQYGPSMFEVSPIHLYKIGRSGRQKKLPPRKDACEMAVHVRRGDAVAIPKRFTPDNVIRDSLEANFGGSATSPVLCIFSEGKIEDFSIHQASSSLDIRYYLNGPTLDTFHNLVTVPELVIAKSSFSYSAALLNTGKVYYLEEFWHTPLDHWINLNSTGKAKSYASMIDSPSGELYSLRVLQPEPTSYREHTLISPSLSFTVPGDWLLCLQYDDAPDADLSLTECAFPGQGPLRSISAAALEEGDHMFSAWLQRPPHRKSEVDGRWLPLNREAEEPLLYVEVPYSTRRNP